MTMPDDGVYAGLLRRGVSRRRFLQFCAAMTATLALPAAYAERVAAAVAAAPRTPLIWLRGQTCGGNTEAFLQSTNPTTADLLLDLLSVDYHEAIMARSGEGALRILDRACSAGGPAYLTVVEGSVPTAADGVYCTIGGRRMKDLVSIACSGAAATIAVGSCAFDGGIAAAAGGPTGAVGLADLVPGSTPLVALPGCPVNTANLAATIVHYLTFKELPPTDSRRRPLFAYGGLIHNQCERRAHFEFGEFVLEWGDEAAQKGWCLYKLGCKGPETFANCPTQRYADGISWAIKAGHGCVGCTMPRSWDAMSPFYRRLPSPIPMAPGLTVDQLGIAMVGGVGAATLVHGAASAVRLKRAAFLDHRAARRAEEAARTAGSAARAAAEQAAEPAMGAAEPPAVAAATDLEPELTTHRPGAEAQDQATAAQDQAVGVLAPNALPELAEAIASSAPEITMTAAIVQPAQPAQAALAVEPPGGEPDIDPPMPARAAHPAGAAEADPDPGQVTEVD